MRSVFVALILLFACRVAHAAPPCTDGILHYYCYTAGAAPSGSEVAGPILQNGASVDLPLSTIVGQTPFSLAGQTVLRSLASRLTDIIQAADFGVVCNGSTNDSPALQAAVNYGSSLGGRIIMVPATGHTCYLAQGLILSDASRSGDILMGQAGGLYWPGPYDNNANDWAQHGSTIQCGDQTNTCVLQAGNGSGIANINFWYAQPTPPAGQSCGSTCFAFTHNWTPTAYPTTITWNGTQNFNWIKNVHIINGDSCLDVEGTSGNVNTLFSHIQDFYPGCFNTVATFHLVDNGLDLGDWHDALWWYPFSSDVLGYTEGDSTHPGHKIGMSMNYVADLFAGDVEFYEDATGILINDATIQSGLGSVTTGMQDSYFAGVNFNQVCNAVNVGANTTHVLRDRFTGPDLNIDFQTSTPTQCAGLNPNAFNFATSNLSVLMTGLQVADAQTVAAVGANNGTIGGILAIKGVSVDDYSEVAPNGSAFLAQGGTIKIPDDLDLIFTSNSNAGPIIAGAAANAMGPGYDAQGSYGQPAQDRFFEASANGSPALARWGERKDTTSETGNNTGSNFEIDDYGDTGAYRFSPFQINRATGLVSMPEGLNVTAPTSCSGQTKGTIYNNNGVANFC